MTRAMTAIALLVAGLLSGCFFGARSDNGAEKLKDTIATMPGVTHAGFATDDAGLGTVTLPNLFVNMVGAAPQQIRAVVDTLKNNPHEDLETVDISVSKQPVIALRGTVSDIDADQFSDDVERLRKLTPLVTPASVIKWTRDEMPDGDLYLSLESSVPTALATIQDTLGDIGVAVIAPDTSSSAQHWKIYFPFSPDQERHVNAQLESLPVKAGAVTVSSGVITELSVAVTDIQAAETELTDVVTGLGAGPDAPLMLSWYVGKIFLPAAPDGMVHVGACGYPSAPGRRLSPEQKALQEPLREQFDTCPR